MSRAFNKITMLWDSTNTNPSILTDTSGNWIIDPIFDDEEFAMKIGPAYWTFPGGNIIDTPMQSDYDAIIFANEQAAAWVAIQTERDRRKTSGGYKVGTNWFHSDDTSRIQQIALVMVGANMPPNIMWKTMSGSFVLMTPTLASQIFQAAVASDMTLFSVAEQKKQAMLASSNPAQYNYLTGWPTAYGE